MSIWDVFRVPLGLSAPGLSIGVSTGPGITTVTLGLSQIAGISSCGWGMSFASLQFGSSQQSDALSFSEALRGIGEQDAAMWGMGELGLIPVPQFVQWALGQMVNVSPNYFRSASLSSACTLMATGLTLLSSTYCSSIGVSLGDSVDCIIGNAFHLLGSGNQLGISNLMLAYTQYQRAMGAFGLVDRRTAQSNALTQAEILANLRSS